MQIMCKTKLLKDSVSHFNYLNTFQNTTEVMKNMNVHLLVHDSRHPKLGEVTEIKTKTHSSMIIIIVNTHTNTNINKNKYI